MPPHLQLSTQTNLHISANLIQHCQHVWSCVQGSQASHERDACGPDKEEHCHGSSVLHCDHPRLVCVCGEGQKDNYRDFYAVYDADKDYERMKAAGVFQSQAIIEEEGQLQGLLCCV